MHKWVHAQPFYDTWLGGFEAFEQWPNIQFFSCYFGTRNVSKRNLNYQIRWGKNRKIKDRSRKYETCTSLLGVSFWGCTQVTVKFTLEQTTMAQKWSRGTAVLFFLTLALDGVGGQRHVPAALPLGKTRYPLYRVRPRAGLDGCGKPRPPTGIRSSDRPARSESIYRLSYPGPLYETVYRR